MDVAESGPVRPQESGLAGLFISTVVQPRCTPGFTLAELLIALAVAGIVLSLGIPAYGAFIDANRLAAARNALTGDLALTRSEAVKRGVQAVICLSADGANCGEGQAWDQGWMVFVDTDRDETRDPDEPILRVKDALRTGTRVRYRSFHSTRYIVYRPTGLTLTNGTFVFCPPAGGRPRALILAKTGRVRTSDTSSEGEPLSCN